MTDRRVAGWRRKFQALLDSQATHHDHTLIVEPDENTAGLRRRLREVYDQRAKVDGILIRIDGHDIGIATRATADREAGKAGDQTSGFDPGSSVGASLPGLPGEYRPVTFTCPDCGTTFLASFYDEREAPSCLKHRKAEVQL